MLFRYSLTTHWGDWKDSRACNFGWAIGNPLIPLCMNAPKEGKLPRSTSFCRVDQPNVLLLTLKQAEDWDGIIIRLIETEGKEITATVTLPFFTIKQAYETNLVEENQKILSFSKHTVKASVKPFGIITLRLRTSLY
jgi:alpha-mannosidase